MMEDKAVQVVWGLVVEDQAKKCICTLSCGSPGMFLNQDMMKMKFEKY